LLFDPTRPAKGLLVLAGATKSGKSTAARGLISLYLDQASSLLGPSDRHPHFITWEDPIEVLLADSPQNAFDRFGISYTPREKGSATHTLQDVTIDALRQTPTVFYMGEIRETTDWEAALQFAGTGHFAVATMHAGSLTESLATILSSVGALDSPNRRSFFAQRIHSIVHLIDFEQLKLPSLWKNTPTSVAALISDGLSSILPHSIDGTNTSYLSTVGRSWFANHLGISNEQRLKAIKLDLQGI